jgi:3-deoxy-D-manno-octulosonate 8-phosphate phosphatase (KDO 8-P phosphatase)
MVLELTSNIKMVLFDVDGVMTDGTIYMSSHGEVIKAFNVKDGLAIELLRRHGILTGIISGKSSEALNLRCNQLGFDKIITGCKNKQPQINDICSEFLINLNEIAFCGDDVLDIPVFDIVGLSVAPSDSHELVRDKADWVTRAKGGKGMVREFVDELLCTQKNLTLEEIYQPLMRKIVMDDLKGIEQ